MTDRSEYAIISLFLSKEVNEVSKRYLDYAEVRAYKEAKNYNNYCKILGYKAIDIRTIRKMKKSMFKMMSFAGTIRHP